MNLAGHRASYAEHWTKEAAMIEFRWVVVLALWTLLIGPVLDFTQPAPTARAKPAPTVKMKTPR